MNDIKLNVNHRTSFSISLFEVVEGRLFFKGDLNVPISEFFVGTDNGSSSFFQEMLIDLV